MEEETKNIIGKGLKIISQLFVAGESNNTIVQSLLEEHRALRNEIEHHHNSMRYMFIFNLTASATIFGFALSNDTFKPILLIIPILSSILGIIFFLHGQRISRLRSYIREEIAPSIRHLLNDNSLLKWEEHIGKKEKVELSWLSLDGIRITIFFMTSVAILFSTFSRAFLPTWIIGVLLTGVLVILALFLPKLWK